MIQASAVYPDHFSASTDTNGSHHTIKDGEISIVKVTKKTYFECYIGGIRISVAGLKENLIRITPPVSVFQVYAQVHTTPRVDLLINRADQGTKLP